LGPELSLYRGKRNYIVGHHLASYMDCKKETNRADKKDTWIIEHHLNL
jgi:hypothetical protein